MENGTPTLVTKNKSFDGGIAHTYTHRPYGLEERHTRHTGLEPDMLECNREKQLESYCNAKENDASERWQAVEREGDTHKPVQCVSPGPL